MDDSTLVLASGNAGKLAELGALLKALGYRLRAQAEWGTREALEDAPSFVENALIKARNAARHCEHPAIADDSGLVVPALGGAPGIHSARYGGRQGDDRANNERLLREMSGLHGRERRAFFHCAMVFVGGADDPVPLVATASWWGSILSEPRGGGGFGYDPLFVPAGRQRSSAELPADVKNRISHRAQAVSALIAALHQRLGHER